MYAHFSKYVAGVLVLVVLVSAACSENNPVDVLGPTAAPQALSLTAEPAVVTPEFLPTTFSVCNAPRFRTRFVVLLGGIRGVAVTGLFVGFTDFLGLAAVPTVLPAAPFGGTTTFSAARVPVPFPATGPNDGLSVPTGFPQNVPVTLEFGCHVRPRGTILVTADTRDGRGRMETARLSVPVGE